MRITHVEIFPIRIPLKETFVISKGPLDFATITIVKIHTDQGIYGIGECCPYRTIETENQAGTVEAARQIAQLFIGNDAREIRKLVRIMDGYLGGNASVKSAFDLALYDLNAKAVGLPLFRYLQGDNDKRISTDMTVSLMSKEEMAEKAAQYQAQGFPALKIKLGERPAGKDIERMIAIREAVGMEIPIRIDANQGWNYLEAMNVLDGISELNIEYCEAPVPAYLHLERIKIVQNSLIPIMGDESVFNHFHAYNTLAEGSVDLINIKLGKSGGITHAMKIAGIAQANGVYCQVGCFSESRLGISALVHFAKAWDNIIYYDLDAPLMHTEDPIIGGLKYQKDWSVTVDETPGIGADYDPEFLKNFKNIRIS